MLTTHRSIWHEMACDRCGLESVRESQQDREELEVFLFRLFAQGWVNISPDTAEFVCPECAIDWLRGKRKK